MIEATDHIWDPGCSIFAAESPVIILQCGSGAAAAWPQIFIRLFLIYNRQPRLAAQLRATGPGICTKLQTFVAKSRLPTDYLQAVQAWAVRNNSTWYIPFLVQLLTETFMRLYVMLHAEHNYKLLWQPLQF